MDWAILITSIIAAIGALFTIFKTKFWWKLFPCWECRMDEHMDAIDRHRYNFLFKKQWLPKWYPRRLCNFHWKPPQDDIKYYNYGKRWSSRQKLDEGKNSTTRVGQFGSGRGSL